MATRAGQAGGQGGLHCQVQGLSRQISKAHPKLGAMQLAAPQTWAPAAVPSCKRQAVSHATRAAPRTRALMVPGDPLVTPDTAQSCASSLLHWHYTGEQPRQEKRPSASSSRETSCRPVGAAQCPHCWRPMERTRLRQPEKAHQRPWRCASSDWCRRPCLSVGSRARVCDEVAAVAHQALADAETDCWGS